MKIWIDAGHGGKDPGAVNGSRMEKEDALRFALELERRFLARGCETVMTRRTDMAVELSARTRLERENACDLALSCHRNAAGTAARGFEVWLHHAATASVVRWAADVARAVGALGLPVRQGSAAPGVYLGYRGAPELDYAVNRETTSPSMLLELGFVTSAADNAMFDASCGALCEAIAAECCRFLGMAESPLPGNAPDYYRTLYLEEQKKRRKWQERTTAAEAALGKIRSLTMMTGQNAV